ncbi:MAG: methanogenesis marker 15 protein [Halobacteriota archaeon]|nr:methanogenesis marker 15 protein [Halobacteriota archaeon]
MPVKIAQISCGSDYSAIQKEINESVRRVDAEVFFPEVDINSIDSVADEFGYSVRSPGLKMMLSRAKSVIDGDSNADAVFVCTCFRCAEGALVRNEVRKAIQSETNLPVVMYSFTERTTATELLTRMEALVTIVKRRHLLELQKQEGLTAGIDSGSTTTNAVIMLDNEVIGTDWQPTTEVMKAAEKALSGALKVAGVKRSELEAIGTTGYGRFEIGRHLSADLIQEEISVNSKGAVYLADHQKGESTVLDIGGMDNKVITVKDGIPDSFTMGGICAGASGRFLEMSARRLGVEIGELGEIALLGNPEKIKMNSYCIVFGIQDLVTSLAAGVSKEDVAAAACYSVAEQVYEQQLQEVEVRMPLIQVGGTSLIKGLVHAMGDILGTDEVIVPKLSQHIGATGAALIVSGLR